MYSPAESEPACYSLMPDCGTAVLNNIRSGALCLMPSGEFNDGDTDNYNNTS